MVTLLEATKDSEKALRESLISSFERIRSIVSDKALLKYKKNRHSMFNVIKDVPCFHKNPILRDTNSDVTKNNYTFESQKGYFLPKKEIKEFYTKGYIDKKYRFPCFSSNDIQLLKDEYFDYISKCKEGLYEKIYSKFPDYVAHLYFPSVVSLIKKNYDFIVQKSMSIFNVEEKDLFFSVGVFLIDGSEKGVSVHQDYAYHLLDQTSADIETSLITFHIAISTTGKSKLHLFTGTHKEILHNLNTLKYVLDNGISIDDELAMYCGCISNYVINNNKLPYDDQNDEILMLSRISRYSQLIYILNKYKNRDIEGYSVDTQPGEFVLFDPAVLHSNGASAGNIEKMNKNLRENADDNISRLSIAIRVMCTKKKEGNMLWMAAREKVETLQKFFEIKCKENKKIFLEQEYKLKVRDSNSEFYTVLANNKLNSCHSPYFSVDEMYNFHAKSGAYEK